MAGRPESPIPEDVPRPLQELTSELREMRAAAGLTLSQLSVRSGLARTTLHESLAGRKVPSWRVVEAVARATNASSRELSRLGQLWQDAREFISAEADFRATGAIAGAAGSELPPGANRVMTSAARETQQRTVLHDLYKRAGRPSVRELADATGLSRSAVHRAVTGQSTAGARTVADGLAARLAPAGQEEWTAKITNAFEGVPPGTEETAPFRALNTGEREVVAEAFADFERSLQRVRNLIAHGSVQAPPEIRAQVMLLAASMEQARSGRSLDSSAPFKAGVLAEHHRLMMQEQSGGAASAGDGASDREDQA